jgi:hypothetical protein
VGSAEYRLRTIKWGQETSEIKKLLMKR